MPIRAPPKPAIAAERAKIEICERAATMPEAPAAAGELRTANMARPDGDRSKFRMSRVISPKITSNTTTAARGLSKLKMVLPKTVRLGDPKVKPVCPLLMA